MAKTTYGTGCFLVMNTGEKAVESSNKLLTTIAWKIGDELHYALEGSVFVGGAAIQFLRDGLELISEAKESEALANSVEDTAGVYFVPALTGLGAPHWDSSARGAIFGLTRGTTKAHIVRAALEAIGLQVNDLIQAMCQDTNNNSIKMRVDGGATANNFLMQFQSDILNAPIERPVDIETTALGAAFLAGLATGLWKDQNELKSLWTTDKEFSPQLTEQKRAELLQKWNTAVERSKNWV
jgi:glycerol kinase